ncbi:MAG TPA: hypothetical protein VF546_07075 [Pyrinomonadaceae bacterium]|jgi:hypothetical protein
MNRWLRGLLLAASALVLLLAGWLWWNRPRPVDMATYAPADALVYLEANSLPAVLEGLTSTDAWRALAPAAGLRADAGQLGWLSRAAAWTGVGPAEYVLLARAQVAVAVVGFEAAEEPEQALHIKPRAALLVETHTSQRRAQPALEKLLGNFARRANGAAEPTRRTAGDAAIVVWPNTRGGLPVVAAFADTLAVIGNDEEAVTTCLAVRRGERAALANDPQLAEMRERMRADDALAFGYVPAAGARRLLAVAALAYAGQFASDQKAQSAAAILLPQLAARLLGGAAWSARVADGAVTDTYFVAVPAGPPARLSAALAPADEQTFDAARLLPADAYQLTRYDFRDPEAAWRELHAALSAHLEVTIAPLVDRFLDEALTPFGVTEPREFLRAAGPEIATVRLSETGEGPLLVARVRDREALRALARKHGGRGERLGAAEFWAGAGEEGTAAGFVGDYVLLGDAEAVRRCLTEGANGRTLAESEAFKRAAGAAASAEPAGIVTLTDERDAARAFVNMMARQSALRSGAQPNDAAFRRALDARAYAVSATRPVEGGFERRTRSAFGQFGTIAGQFAPAAAGH